MPQKNLGKIKSFIFILLNKKFFLLIYTISDKRIK